MSSGLWRVEYGDGIGLARGPADSGPVELLDPGLTVGAFLDGSGPSLADLPDLPAVGPVPERYHVLVPLDRQPVWAAGVTFERSRAARKEESAAGGDVYDQVYEAERPELFVKAMPGAARGTGEPVAVRADSAWNVPEPELVLVCDHAGRIAGYALGNDMSSRSIEGENPLYLPQAKVYVDSCALGPCLVPAGAAPELSGITIGLDIVREGVSVYADAVPVAKIRRTPAELAAWLFRAQRFPAGVALLTGTSIVPDPDFTLRPGDQVTITATGLGVLTNPVYEVS
ncbi:MAG: fumarylacetoacetate hydrolase family protein [Mycobacteriales bacterium]